MGDSSDDQWYYSISDGTVAQGKEASWSDRMGPYPDKASAERALDIVAERNRVADEQDREWNG